MKPLVGCLCLLLVACGKSTDPGPDAGSAGGADAAALPEYELKLSMDPTGAALAGVNSNNAMDPASASKVTDLQPVTYTISKTLDGSTASARVEFQRSGHTMTALVNTSASSVATQPASGVGMFTLDGICASARGATGFKVTWACEGTRTSTGHGSGSISLSAPGNSGCLTSYLTEDGQVVDNAWDQQGGSRTVSAVDGQSCWLENAQINVSGLGGTKGGTGSAQAKITLTVDPVY